MPDQFAKPASQLGAQIPNTAKPAAGMGLTLDETGRVDPGLLQQAVATNGQVLAWNTTQNKWVPTSLSGGPTPTPALPSKLYDFTISGADQASIDTNVDGPGAGLLSTAYDLLEVWINGRTDDATAVPSIFVTVNNDTGAVYDLMQIAGVNATASAGNSLAQTAWSLNMHGNGGGANYPSAIAFTLPRYAQTTFYKVAELRNMTPDSTAANNQAAFRALNYRSTSAITRLKVAAGGAAKLKVGTSLLVYGR